MVDFIEAGPEIEVTILLIGSSSVGKSALVRSFMGESFLFTNAPSSGVDTKCRNIRLEEQGMVVKVNLLDAAGKQTYQTIVSSYFRKADCYAIVFDVFSHESFGEIDNWIRAIEDRGFSENKLFVTVGNKIDLQKQTKVFPSEIEKYCENNTPKLLPFLTSSKTGENVEDMFYDIVEECIKKGYGKNTAIRRSTLDMRSEADKESNSTTAGGAPSASNGGCPC